MEQLALYLLKSSLCTALFTAVYLLFLKKETFYRFNRYFLLTGLACAITLPLYTYTYQVTIPSFPMTPLYALTAEPIGSKPYLWTDLALLVYLLVAMVFLLSKGLALLQLKRKISALGYVDGDGYKLVKTNLFRTSFSVFNYIIINPSSEHTKLEHDLILAHEEAHVKQYHWFDLMFAQVFCSMQWFNPLAWFYQGLIKENHEFLADAAVLEQGNSPALYRATLINHALGVPVFVLASSFSHLDKMNRIKMMMRPKSSAFRKLAALALVPCLVFLVWVFAKPEYIMTQPVVKALRAPEPLTTYKLEPDTLADQKLKSELKQKVRKNAKVKVKKPVLIAPKQELQITRPALPVLDSVSVEKRPQSLFVNANPQPLYFLDDIPVHSVNVIATDQIEAIHVLKGHTAIEKYGESGKNGVILIVSKKAAALKTEQ